MTEPPAALARVGLTRVLCSIVILCMLGALVYAAVIALANYGRIGV
jgi:hypothetical protein